MPDDVESYTQKWELELENGTSISIIHLKEQGKINQFERAINKKFESVHSQQEMLFAKSNL